MTITKWLKRIRYKRWQQKNVLTGEHLSRSKARRIIHGQLLYIREREINIALIDECLDCLFPDRGKWEYGGKERIWNRLVERVTHEEARHRRENQHSIGMNRIGKLRFTVIVVMLLLMGLMIGSTVAYALGINVLDYVVKWTKEILSITVWADYFEADQTEQMYISEIEETGIASDLHSVLIEKGIKVKLPQWIPEGFRFESYSQYSVDSGISVIEANYVANDGKSFVLSISRIPEGFIYERAIEKSTDKENGIYSIGEDEYFIIRNIDNYAATWAEENCWIMIDGALEEIELERMIDSMYE